MPHGQKIAFERLIDCLNNGNNGRPSVLFQCNHEIADCRVDIPAERIPVARRYYKGKWKDGDGRTAKEYTESFLNWVNGPFQKERKLRMESRWTIKGTDNNTICNGADRNIGEWLLNTLNERYPGRFTLCMESDATSETF